MPSRDVNHVLCTITIYSMKDQNVIYVRRCHETMQAMHHLVEIVARQHRILNGHFQSSASLQRNRPKNCIHTNSKILYRYVYRGATCNYNGDTRGMGRRQSHKIQV